LREIQRQALKYQGDNRYSEEKEGRQYYGRKRKEGPRSDEKGREALATWRHRQESRNGQDEVAKIIDKLKKEGKVSSPKRCFYAPAD